MYEGSKPTETPAFGNTANAYATHRLGFPSSMYEKLFTENILKSHTNHLDLGTGTGTFARTVAARGLHVTALDIDIAMLTEARKIADSEGVAVNFKKAPSEETSEPDNHYHSVSAGQCWHWFDGPKAAAEAWRILKPRGHLLICHYDWIPTKGNIIEASENLILKYNPAWKAAGGTGIYAKWFLHLADAGFKNIQSFSYDEPALYNRDNWVGRLEASAGIAILSPTERNAFKDELTKKLNHIEGHDPLMFDHRVFCVWGQKA